MGRYYFMMKDLDNYEKFLLTADSIKSYPIFKYNLAMIYYTDRKEYDKAYGYFKTAFDQGYSNKEASDNFVLFCIESAYDYFNHNEYDKAIGRCKIALKNDPSNSVASYNMGIYLISKGNKKEAAAMWRRAITQDPKTKEAYKSLSLYYQYDVPLNDSAIYFATMYKKYGGNEEVLTNIK
jgi:tetratricopeptide (TPR) repeat protein